jgi:hypothetical protein
MDQGLTKDQEREIEKVNVFYLQKEAEVRHDHDHDI